MIPAAAASDAFRDRRGTYRIADPIVRLSQLVVRRHVVLVDLMRLYRGC
jgi:hypothetical protein